MFFLIGKYCTLQLVSEQIQNQLEEGIDEKKIEDEINISRGCERKLHLEFLQNISSIHCLHDCLFNYA